MKLRSVWKNMLLQKRAIFFGIKMAKKCKTYMLNAIRTFSQDLVITIKLVSSKNMPKSTVLNPSSIYGSYFLSRIAVNIAINFSHSCFLRRERSLWAAAAEVVERATPWGKFLKAILHLRKLSAATAMATELEEVTLISLILNKKLHTRIPVKYHSSSEKLSIKVIRRWQWKITVKKK